MRSRPFLLPLLVILATSLAACGDDDDAAPTDLGAVDDTIEVLAEDISFPEEVYETTAGRIGFVYENVGNIRHTLVIEDVDGLDLDVSKKGDVDQGAVDLEPGTYVLFCDVPSHRPAGMVADLVVN